MTTVAELLRCRADSDAVAVKFGEQVWTYRQLVAEAARRCDLLEEQLVPGRPRHIGVLLDNVPDYLFWLAAAALSGSVVVGINSTYRGEQLGLLIRHTDCQLLVTSPDHAPLLDGVDTGVAAEQTFYVDTPEYAERLQDRAVTPPAAQVSDDDLFLLIFTSGSTGIPKAVRCTHGRYARTGGHVATIAQLSEGDTVYSPLPFFHSSSLFTGWASALHIGAAIATRARFSASQTLPDIRRFNATMMTYTGKVLNYILASPERPNDSDNPLRLAVGNEASLRDIREFARRYGADVRDSYGSTEGIIIVRRDPTMPDGALGTAADSVKVLDPETKQECPPAVFGPDGRTTNLAEAIGEIVETSPTNGFEGYYRNEEATAARFRAGYYWSGDLAYRDAQGWLYFAGRSNEWLRVDGENFAAAPVEAIIARYPEVRAVAVYAVPDEPVGDRVMAAIELTSGSVFHPAEFDAFMRAQPDLGTKWLPAFIRLDNELPKLASMKLDKQSLRRDAWRADAVYWRPARGESLRSVTAADRVKLDGLLSN